ncbi:MAG: nicotinate-nucleotide--dimethylbenzimidazole phosphoribosyltransferase [Lachnospiraceae bacterium]|nr:nicotinate-nucleotide--dimethylbenzimidazole phosphoribosyltransferase [Lachnospiraceae bacterium]
MTLQETLDMIKPADAEARERAVKRWDAIAKPLHSLGKLEDAVAKIAGIQGSDRVKLDKKALVIMCADNGVVEEGVTQTDNSVTAIVAENFLDKKTSVAVMADKLGVDLFAYDVGMVRDTRVEKRKVACGTKNLAKGPAMTRDECIKTIETGINIVFELKEKGYDIITTGEMGIGNTTTSSAVGAVLTGQPVEIMTGKGSGLTDEALIHKKQVIRDSITLNKPDRNDPIDVLAKEGGFDICGLTGVFLGGAACGIPVVIDGFISSVAALAAYKLSPKAIDYILPSHVSKEPAGKFMLDALGLNQFLTCDMCLGEGTGAVMLMPIIECALEVYNRMSTFEDIEIDAYVPL